MAIQERIRHATKADEHYVPSAGRPGEGMALQADQDSYYFGTRAKEPSASMGNEVTLSFADAISNTRRAGSLIWSHRVLC